MLLDYIKSAGGREKRIPGRYLQSKLVVRETTNGPSGKDKDKVRLPYIRAGPATR